MYQLFKDFLAFSYTGNTYQTWEGYVLYGAIAFTIILTALFFDLIYRVIRSFVRK